MICVIYCVLVQMVTQMEMGAVQVSARYMYCSLMIFPESCPQQKLQFISFQLYRLML